MLCCKRRQPQMPPPCQCPRQRAMPMPEPAASASASADAANNLIANASATCVFVLPGALPCTCGQPPHCPRQPQVPVQVPAPTASANAAAAYRPMANASACVSCGYGRPSASVAAPASSASAAAANHPNASACFCTASCWQPVPVPVAAPTREPCVAWWWVTAKGARWHLRQGCSGASILMTKRTAITMGLTPYKKCTCEG